MSIHVGQRSTRSFDLRVQNFYRVESYSTNISLCFGLEHVGQGASRYNIKFLQRSNYFSRKTSVCLTHVYNLQGLVFRERSHCNFATFSKTTKYLFMYRMKFTRAENIFELSWNSVLVQWNLILFFECVDCFRKTHPN